MRLLYAFILFISALTVRAQHIFGLGAVFPGGPKRHEVEAELTTIDVDPACEIFMLIEVDREGKVLSAKLDPIAPSCPDSTVLAKAIRSARARVFNADPKAPARQQGMIHWAYRQPETDMLNDVAVPDMEEVVQDAKVYEFSKSEVPPEFPGGKTAMERYIAKVMRYPESARAAKQEGVVLISFIVEKDGKLSTFTLEKGVEIPLNQEAMHVLMNMPNWKPGMHNGAPVRVRCEFPVTFKL